MFVCRAMFASLLWWFKSPVFVYMSFSNYVNICRTHTQSPEHYQTSFVTVVSKSILSVTLVTYCHKEVTQREMCHLWVHMIYVFMFSKYSKRVIIVKVHHSSSPISLIPHLAILRKNFQTKQPSLSGPHLSCIFCSINPLAFTLLLETSQCVVHVSHDWCNA